MKQCTSLQEGFNAVKEHLENLCYNESDKRRYKKAFEDLSSYYESRHIPGYQSVINKAYRDDVIAHYNVNFFEQL